MRPPIVLAGSPFLSPAAWDPLRAALTRRGFTVLLAPTRPLDVVRSPQQVLDAVLADVPDGVVVVAHSNAGLYVPDIASRRDVVAAVHLDAVLPEGGRVPVAPPTLAEAMAPLADDGMLPPWRHWFDPVDVERLVDDPAARERALADQPPVALDYLLAGVDVDPDWDAALPTAYLGFGTTYADEQAVARRRGWHVEAMAGGHLHHVTAPEPVADRLVTLLRACCGPG